MLEIKRIKAGVGVYVPSEPSIGLVGGITKVTRVTRDEKLRPDDVNFLKIVTEIRPDHEYNLRKILSAQATLRHRHGDSEAQFVYPKFNQFNVS